MSERGAMLETLRRVATNVESDALSAKHQAGIPEYSDWRVELRAMSVRDEADAARLRSLATILESAQWGPDGSLDPVTCGRIRELLEEEDGDGR